MWPFAFYISDFIGKEKKRKFSKLRRRNRTFYTIYLDLNSFYMNLHNYYLKHLKTIKSVKFQGCYWEYLQINDQSFQKLDMWRSVKTAPLRPWRDGQVGIVERTMSIVGMVWTVHSTAINIIENIGGLALGIG
jgi:hypothetical protein